MKIIAVNISKTINEKGPEKATERAWKLNIQRAGNYRFVIGVTKGKIYAFERLNVFRDNEHKNRVAFELKECSKQWQKDIEDYIKNVNLRYITTKYIE